MKGSTNVCLEYFRNSGIYFPLFKLDTLDTWHAAIGVGFSDS